MTTPESEFSPDFVEKMENAMGLSFYKYGPVKEAYPDKIDAVESLQVRLERYAKTGNTEFLVDVANFAMIEFMLPRHPEAHFKVQDSQASPGRVDAETKRRTHDDNQGRDLKSGYSSKSSVANMRHIIDQ